MSTTPMMKQYEEAKSACGDAILLFRMGDFYELFHDDAVVASKILGLTLTSRDKNSNPTPMAGFPYHQLEGYLGKLIRAGHRVAVCDQMENPATAKGLVRREVTRVVSPGTAIDDDLIDPRQPNYLLGLKLGKSVRDVDPSCGLAWIDLSTGRFFAMTCPRRSVSSEIARIAPSEVVFAESELPQLPQFSPDIMRSSRPDWSFNWAHAKNVLQDHFQVASLEGFGFSEDQPLPLQAAGGVLSYLKETQKYSLAHIDRLIPYQRGHCLEIDNATRRSLELVTTIRSGSRQGSLLSVLDQSVTTMGSRVIVEWLNNPLTDISLINERLDAVEILLRNERVVKDLGELLAQVHDLERSVSKVTTGRATPRDLALIAITLSRLPRIKAKLEGHSSKSLQELQARISLFEELRTQLSLALSEDCPPTTKEGGFIKTGFDPRLDELRNLAAGGKDWIANYQATITEQSGISSLKVGYNRVFGYYLEVTNTHREKIPPTFIRKQTLKNAERYITPELKEYEEKILSADDQALQLELELFEQLRVAVLRHSHPLRETAQAIAQIDAIRGLAVLAARHGYCRPQLTDQRTLQIVAGRHPVLDVNNPELAFVPNDTRLDPEIGVIALITGPNMAGKSTYIRQVALICLMTQMGSFVPAKQATIGVVDRIFARVGASDELARGQSTFMVEMTETAHILNTATDRSLIILDEIGRGTSTYDGVSLAWAIVEFLHDEIKARTLFATHYHELTDLAKELPQVQNLTVLVREWEEKIVFLHQIVPGATDKSYGIHVARLAGIPAAVNQRAKEVLAKLEADYLTPENQPKLARKKPKSDRIQLTLFGPPTHPLVETLRNLDTNALTPLQSLQLIHDWQAKLRQDDDAAN
ncbi:MAG: DNA mismatch repair protein MutS [Planctomycetaceae bacterium]|nr:DNA mismatch repair protein MutS [Planctomycetaceae bacterium]